MSENGTVNYAEEFWSDIQKFGNDESTAAWLRQETNHAIKFYEHLVCLAVAADEQEAVKEYRRKLAAAKRAYKPSVAVITESSVLAFVESYIETFDATREVGYGRLAMLADLCAAIAQKSPNDRFLELEQTINIKLADSLELTYVR